MGSWDWKQTHPKWQWQPYFQSKFLKVPNRKITSVREFGLEYDWTTDQPRYWSITDRWSFQISWQSVTATITLGLKSSHFYQTSHTQCHKWIERWHVNDTLKNSPCFSLSPVFTLLSSLVTVDPRRLDLTCNLTHMSHYVHHAHTLPLIVGGGGDVF